MENEINYMDDPPQGLVDSVGVEGVAVVSSLPNGSIPEASEYFDGKEKLGGSSFSQLLVYRQDVVLCKNHGSKLGVVMEVSGDVDSDGSSTDYDSESGDDEHKGGNHNNGSDAGGGNIGGSPDGKDESENLSDGQVRVVWSDGCEKNENISDIVVVDRGFLHGDVVASSSDPTGQLGLIEDISITVDLQASTGEIRRLISSKDLKRISKFAVGDYVVRGPWLGRVDDVLDNVTVMFDDGSVCKVVKADPLRLKPVSKVLDDSDCPYYPGQQVKAVSSSVFKTSRWLSGLWKSNRLEGTVIKVQTGSVIVYWIASAYLGLAPDSSSVPSEEQNPKGLTLLSCYSHASWQLGDWCLLPPSFSTDGNSITNNSGSNGQMSYNCHLKEFSAHGIADNILNFPSQPLELAFPNFVAKEPEATAGSPVPDIHGQLTVSEHSKNACGAITVTTRESNILSNGVRESDAKKVAESSFAHPESSTSSVMKEPGHENWHAYRKKFRRVFFKREKKARKREDDFERAFKIICTLTKVNVSWQDGTREFGVESKSLIPIQAHNDHEFFPEEYVVEKCANEGEDSSYTRRVGIVGSVNAKERTVRVRWLKPVSRPEDPREFDCDEIVSAYELDEHPDYNYSYGDVVVRLCPVSASDGSTSFNSVIDEQIESTDHAEEEVSASGDPSEHDDKENKCMDESCANFTCISWVGNITGLQNGDIEVTWADGMVSKVGPQAIYVVGREDDGESLEGNDDAASWETVDDDQIALIDNNEEADVEGSVNILVSSDKSTLVHEEESTAQNGPFSLPLTAFNIVSRFVGLFSRGRAQSEQSTSDQSVVDENECQETVELPKNDAAEVFPEMSGVSDLNVIQDTPKVKFEGISYCSSPLEINSIVQRQCDMNRSSIFKHFDISLTPQDHYFFGNGAQGSCAKKWVKVVQKEWNILEKNLPEDIYVRVFEDRMDLSRAVIIGAPGTPYQDGLFFFDFQLSPDYPQAPPSVYYHSGGLRINPNLYVEGKVCLSLLNTWTGKGIEVWDPSSSSILQVLVSLQGLVLNSKPYFNEAGYEKQVGTMEGEKNSVSYNENTYLLNLKSMTYILRRQPKHFEDFVKDHFHRRGHYILKACEAYMGGSLIGSLDKDASVTEKSKEQSCSVGFKLMLAKILPRLISALNEVGVDCLQFEYLLKS